MAKVSIVIAFPGKLTVFVAHLELVFTGDDNGRQGLAVLSRKQYRSKGVRLGTVDFYGFHIKLKVQGQRIVFQSQYRLGDFYLTCPCSQWQHGKQQTIYLFHILLVLVDKFRVIGFLPFCIYACASVRK